MPFYFWLLYPNKNNNNETNKDKTSKDETSKDKVKNFYISKKPQYKKVRKYGMNWSLVFNLI